MVKTIGAFVFVFPFFCRKAKEKGRLKRPDKTG